MPSVDYLRQFVSETQAAAAETRAEAAQEFHISVSFKATGVLVEPFENPENQAESAERSQVKMPIITCVVAEANSELQQLTNASVVPESQDQSGEEGEESESNETTGRKRNNRRPKSESQADDESNPTMSSTKLSQCDTRGKDFQRKIFPRNPHR